jgi:hypothetical protein
VNAAFLGEYLEGESAMTWVEADIEHLMCLRHLPISWGPSSCRIQRSPLPTRLTRPLALSLRSSAPAFGPSHDRARKCNRFTVATPLPVWRRRIPLAGRRRYTARVFCPKGLALTARGSQTPTSKKSNQPKAVLHSEMLGRPGRVDHLCALYARARRSRAAGRIRPELWTAAPADFFLT